MTMDQGMVHTRAASLVRLFSAWRTTATRKVTDVDTNRNRHRHEHWRDTSWAMTGTPAGTPRTNLGRRVSKLGRFRPILSEFDQRWPANVCRIRSNLG